MPNFSQRHLKNKWNEIAAIVNAFEGKKPKEKRPAPLPFLIAKGNCYGFANAHIYYHQHGLGDEFSELLELWSTKSAAEIAADFIAVPPKPYTKELFFLIGIVKKTQEKQAEYYNWGFELNLGMNKPNAVVKVIEYENDIVTELEKLQPNESFEISFQRHSITVYKDKNNCYQTYDSNWQKMFPPTNDIQVAAKNLHGSIKKLTLFSLFFQSPFYRLDKKIFAYLSSVVIDLPWFKDHIVVPTVAKFKHFQKKSAALPQSTVPVSTPSLEQPDTRHQSTYKNIFTRFNDFIFAENIEGLAGLSIEHDDVASLKKHMKKGNLNPNFNWSFYGTGADCLVSPIEYAIDKNAHQCLRYLMQHRDFDVNHLNEYDFTYLQSAAAWSDLQTVQCLLDKGADPNKKNARKETALLVAIRFGNFEVAKLLYPLTEHKVLVTLEPLSNREQENMVRFASYLREQVEAASAPNITGTKCHASESWHLRPK